MNADLSLLSLIGNASPVVQLVMLLLLLASMLSWALIYHKWRIFASARRDALGFEDRFWSGGDVGALYKDLQGRREDLQGLERIFDAGFAEYARLHRQNSSTDRIIEGTHRSMRVVLSRETEAVESNLSFLATVGSTSPYVGLFGTVWGIMNSFRALGNVHQATLAMVAPGIAEALIATAMGLFAAIPAVIAYNRFASDAERLINRYDTFVEEFTTLLHRQSSERESRSRVATAEV